MQGKCMIFAHPRVSSILLFVLSCIIAIQCIDIKVTEAISFDILNVNNNTSLPSNTTDGTRLIFEYNNTIPNSSVIPIAFNITEDNMLDNLRVSATCGEVMCNFMIITYSSYLEFMQSPSLRSLKAKAMTIQMLNVTNSNRPNIVFVTPPDSYVFVSVNPNPVNSTLLTIRGELKYSYGRGFVAFLQIYWYIIIIGAVVIVFGGISIAVIANGVKGRDLFNGMTSYLKKDKSQRCLLTDDDMKEEIGFKTVTSLTILQGEELKTYSSDSDASISGYTN